MKALGEIFHPKEIEHDIYVNWIEQGYFHTKVDKNKKPYTIVISSPNVTGVLHMGHGLNNTLQDILIRYHHMKGYSALWVLGSVKLIPTFIIKELGLINTHLALFLPVVSAFGTFLIQQFVERVSDEITESAVLDGASEFQIFVHIMLPLMRSVLISLTIFTFIGIWNDFVWPFVVTTDSELHTLNLALATLQSNYLANYGLIMAGPTLIFLPPFILYIILQKTFVEGIAMTGSKES